MFLTRSTVSVQLITAQCERFLGKAEPAIYIFKNYFFCSEFQHVASDNCLLFKEQAKENLDQLSLPCFWVALCFNLSFHSDVTHFLVFPNQINFQAVNLNFIDSLFSCRDNGGFLAELNSDARLEAFTSLLMVLTII